MLSKKIFTCIQNSIHFIGEEPKQKKKLVRSRMKTKEKSDLESEIKPPKKLIKNQKLFPKQKIEHTKRLYRIQESSFFKLGNIYTNKPFQIGLFHILIDTHADVEMLSLSTASNIWAYVAVCQSFSLLHHHHELQQIWFSTTWTLPTSLPGSKINY